jgi:hypothetical protein
MRGGWRRVGVKPLAPRRRAAGEATLIVRQLHRLAFLGRDHAANDPRPQAFGWTRRSTCSRRRDAKVDARIVLGLRSGAAVRRIRLISWSRPSARGGPVNDSLTMGSQDISRSVVHAIMGLRASRAERRQENPRPHGALKRRAAANEVELSSSMRRIAGGCRCGGWHRDELDDLRPDSIGLGPGDPPCSRRRAAKVDAQIVLRFQTGPSTASTWPWARQSGRTPGTGHDR